MYRDVLTDSLGFDVSTNLPCIFKTKYIYSVQRQIQGAGPPYGDTYMVNA